MDHPYQKEMRNHYTSHDLGSRLHDTIGLYKGVPHYLQVVGGKIQIHEMPTLSSSQTIDPSDPDLDIQSLEVGYFNLKVQNEWRVGYAYRNPSKSGYRQTISASNLNLAGIDGSPWPWGGVNYVNHGGFVDSLKNIYPSFRTDFEGEIAFSKSVAVKKDTLGVMTVYVRREPVGYLTPTDTTLHIKPCSIDWVLRRELSAFPFKLQG